MAWLYAPTERRALRDVAKLAAALRSGEIPAAFLDGGGDVRLGAVGRVLLLGPADLGVGGAGRRFVLARGSDAWCLAEVVDGEAGDREAELLIEAATAAAAREGARTVIAWLVAERVAPSAVALLGQGGGVATSTG